MSLFKQASFTGGLNAQLDATKIPDDAYPLLINGRTRRNVIAPTNRHVKLDAPQGTYQGLYIAGSYLLLFVSGIAYYGDITADPIIFIPVTNWVPMSSTVPRIYAELAPATSNLFSRDGTVDTVNRTFNNTIAVFAQALYCFDGLAAQAILPTNAASPLGSYATWTKDAPLYVPPGVLPAYASNKLFLASPDRLRVLSSVSGRCSDFVINIDSAGNKGGDADTVSQGVSYNPITAIRSISTGEVLVGTLYGTFVLEMDYTNTIFGEPFQQPRFLFPAGPINEISIVDILSDTAMITQSGIHAFNAVAQAKRESNNFPLGAKIRGLLTNPNTGKAIIQNNTCATVYDDYGMFAVNTVFGYGVLVYDTTTQNWQAFDTSFGRVKQFATTKISGIERLFYITHDNEIFEAFASEEKNSTRVLLGEWTPNSAEEQTLTYMVNSVFANVRSSGQIKFSVYADHGLVASTVLNVTQDTTEISLPMAIPFPNAKSVQTPGFHFDHKAAWRMSAMLEWNFSGELTDFSVDGKTETGDNVKLTVPDVAREERLVFFGSSGYSDELNPGGTFDSTGFVLITVVKGTRYAYLANGDGRLVNGNKSINSGIFTAAANSVAIEGVNGDAYTFSLRTAESYVSVLTAIERETSIRSILHGGGFAYPSGRQIDVEIAQLPLRYPFKGVAGTADLITDSGSFYYNLTAQPRFGLVSYDFVDVFFFNGDASEPNGTDALSIQTGIVRNWLNSSTKPFKILVVYSAPYTNDASVYPGNAGLRYLIELPGLSAILSSSGKVMERFDIDGFPLFVCGTGGQPLGSFQPNTTSAFRDSSLGYLHLAADALTCTLTFRDINNNTLDTYALYA